MKLYVKASKKNGVITSSVNLRDPFFALSELAKYINKTFNQPINGVSVEADERVERVDYDSKNRSLDDPFYAIQVYLMDEEFFSDYKQNTFNPKMKGHIYNLHILADINNFGGFECYLTKLFSYDVITKKRILITANPFDKICNYIEEISDLID